jgi:hypothetical protein
MSGRRDPLREGEDLALIRNFMMSDWDPIGVAGNPGAANEYDRYAHRVLNRLKEGQNADAIAAYLIEVAATSMMLRSARITERSQQLAKKLVAMLGERI